MIELAMLVLSFPIEPTIEFVNVLPIFSFETTHFPVTIAGFPPRYFRC